MKTSNSINKVRVYIEGPMPCLVSGKGNNTYVVKADYSVGDRQYVGRVMSSGGDINWIKEQRKSWMNELEGL